MTSNSNDDTAETIFKNHLSTDLTALPLQVSLPQP